MTWHSGMNCFMFVTHRERSKDIFYLPYTILSHPTETYQTPHGRLETMYYWLCFAVIVTIATSLDVKIHRSYDLVIIGAGAGGLFASGAAQLLGKRTVLIENGDHIGGDCTNSACVPSKALRAAAGQTGGDQAMTLKKARQYVADTVNLVRGREDPQDIQERNGSVELLLVDSCRFVSASEVEVRKRNSTSEPLILRGSRFMIATGASPVVPRKFEREAKRANVPLLTYRSLLSPEGNRQLWDLEVPLKGEVRLNRRRRVVVVGGGAAGCELVQSLARLSGDQTDVILIAPDILPTEDIIMRDAALRLLENSGVTYHRGRLKDIQSDRTLVLDTGKSISSVDAVLLCLGRSPEGNLLKLDLKKADVAWTDSGVSVIPGSLRSTTNHRVYAAGDCADATSLRERTATHAAWTSFHAVRNAFLPKLLWFGSPSAHRCVPRVIYTEPELACVGMTKRECIQKFGINGFRSMLIPEVGTDRADMERSNRDTTVCFVELRAEAATGRILGGCFCGPAAAEMANTLGMAIMNRLTVGDMARSICSYPSYGYLMHRIALSMYLSDSFGLIEIVGPIPGFVSKMIRWIYSQIGMIMAVFIRFMPVFGERRRRRRHQEALGSSHSVYVPVRPGFDRRIVSFSDLKANATLSEFISRRSPGEFKRYSEWDEHGKKGKK
mmetsp:Transcript_9477/g.18176  ORF Transcript_9477/g.18176 Transcript_9477/m.18176 type:complete len:668 (-) Transcript_9477:109-2112(-)